MNESVFSFCQTLHKTSATYFSFSFGNDLFPFSVLRCLPFESQLSAVAASLFLRKRMLRHASAFFFLTIPPLIVCSFSTRCSFLFCRVQKYLFVLLSCLLEGHLPLFCPLAHSYGPNFLLTADSNRISPCDSCPFYA